LREAIEGFFRDMGKASFLSATSVLDGWAGAVGEKAAQHSRAVALVDGVLEVEVDSPLWGSWVFVRKGQILRRLRAEGGDKDLRRLRVRTSGRR
jgi:predicted nucleic acid-binding Zn ribbon protein